MSVVTFLSDLTLCGQRQFTCPRVSSSTNREILATRAHWKHETMYMYPDLMICRRSKSTCCDRRNVRHAVSCVGEFGQCRLRRGISVVRSDRFCDFCHRFFGAFAVCKEFQKLSLC